MTFIASSELLYRWPLSLFEEILRALHCLSFLRSITKSYYRNSVGALLVYDICNRDSYQHIPVWMMEAKRHIEPHKAVFILVGCKLDLAADEDQVNIRLCTVYTEI